MWQSIYEKLEERGRLPNKLSIGMGELIRAAREERGMSQEELAKSVYRRRPSISEIENGKMYADIETLLYMAQILEKPLLYFIPKRYRPKPDISEMRDDEAEFLMVFRRMTDEQKRVALMQMRALLEI